MGSRVITIGFPYICGILPISEGKSKVICISRSVSLLYTCQMTSLMITSNQNIDGLLLGARYAGLPGYYYRVSLHMWYFATFLRERAWLFVYLDRQVCYIHVK